MISFLTVRWLLWLCLDLRQYLFDSESVGVCVFCPQSLKWLDLKDNPLEPGLAKAAGDCLDEKQCKQCASKVGEREREKNDQLSSPQFVTNWPKVSGSI